MAPNSSTAASNAADRAAHPLPAGSLTDCAERDETAWPADLLVFDTPKSHEKRVLRPSLAARIGRHLETLPGGEDALLFVTPGGKPPLRYNQGRKAYVDPAVAAAGLTDVTPHDLRSSHGTLVADRYGVMTAAHRLGHSNASVTTRHYAWPVAGRDDQVATAADIRLSGDDETDPVG